MVAVESPPSPDMTEAVVEDIDAPNTGAAGGAATRANVSGSDVPSSATVASPLPLPKRPSHGPS
jgi:hypothetical protein